MLKLNLDIKGLDKLQKAISFAPGEFREALDETLALVMEMVKLDAFRFCPKRTGTLARSIYWRKVSQLVYQIGVLVYYGVFVEFGTSKMLARPFLRPAIAQHEMQIQQLFRDQIEKWIQRRGE